MALLEAGWNVLALDRERIAIELLKSQVQDQLVNRLQTEVKNFGNVAFKTNFDLINSSYALSFCKPEDFPVLWSKITRAIIPGGRFSGQLFGIHDEMADREDMNFHTKEQVEGLFNNFTIEYFEEEDKDGPTASGRTKHWHVFHIVAKKYNFSH